MKLGLGTAQFGMRYGVGNSQGKTPLQEVKNIIIHASDVGVEYIDTAYLYGNSEKVLGQCLPAEHHFKIVTKTPALNSLPSQEHIREAYLDKFNQSLQDLKQDAVYALLVHDAEDLLSEKGDHLYGALQKIKAVGGCYKIGVSAYDRNRLDEVLDRYELDMVQLPLNVFDQRVLADNYLGALKSRNIEVHVRSVFLQGLLLMPINKWPECFAPIRAHAKRYQDFAAESTLSLIEAALGFAAGVAQVDQVICGVNTLAQWQQLCESWQVLNPALFSQFALDDVDYLDPRRWQL